MEIRYLGQQPYQATYQAMQQFTQNRCQNSVDKIWLLEHPLIYTAGKSEKNIPNHLNTLIITVDRGGKTTYHGPGQLIIYLLLNLNTYQIGVRSLVDIIENSMIQWLKLLNIQNAQAKKKAPGVYINEQKIASLGLRIHKQACYHGLSVNFNCDLNPFKKITPCGQPNLQTTSVEQQSNTTYTTQEKIHWHWKLAQYIKTALTNKQHHGTTNN